MTKTAAAKRVFHEIYDDSYWGSGRTDPNMHSKEILDNRESLRCSKGLTKWYAHKAGITNKFDHTEAYKTKAGAIVLFTSPYSVTSEDAAYFISLGMSEIPPMYCTTARTFMIEFPNGYVLRAWRNKLLKK